MPSESIHRDDLNKTHLIGQRCRLSIVYKYKILG